MLTTMAPSSSMLRRCCSQPLPVAFSRPSSSRQVYIAQCAQAARAATSRGHCGLVSRASVMHSMRAATSGRKHAVVVKAGWGAPVDFKPAKLAQNTKVATDLHTIVLDVGKEIAAGYTKPGQFIQVKVGDSKPGFFAIANAPDANNQGALELLIKVQPGATAELLCNAAAGTEVSVSPVQGKGFPVEKLPADSVDTVVLCASGSGITPLRAVIESGVLGKRKEIKLYYGTQNAEATAFKERFADWEKAGVKITQVFSENSSGKYIQDIMEAEPADAASGSVGALLCGHKDMCQKVTSLLTGRGVAADRILLNF